MLLIPILPKEFQPCRTNTKNIHRENQEPLFEDVRAIKHISRETRSYVLQRSIKFTKTVFFVPSLRTCGGLITVLRLSPARSGLFSLKILKTLSRSCMVKNKYTNK